MLFAMFTNMLARLRSHVFGDISGYDEEKDMFTVQSRNSFGDKDVNPSPERSDLVSLLPVDGAQFSIAVNGDAADQRNVALTRYIDATLSVNLEINPEPTKPISKPE